MFAVVGVVVLASAGWWLSQPAVLEAEEGGRPPFMLPVTLTTLERGDIQPRAPLSGTVRARRRARLGFDTEGLLERIEKQEADRVEAGALLARLGSADEELELASAEAALTLAERELELLQAGEREEEKRRLLAVLEAARAEAQLTQWEVERGEKLLVDRIISQADQDKRLTEFQAADKRRAAAEEDYQRALAGSRPEDLAIAEARLAQAQARVETAQHEVEKTSLVAPFAGAIVERFVSEGDYVSAGAPVFELVDLDHVEVHVEVPGRLAARLGPGTGVRITLSRESDFELERELDATIPAADEASRGFRAIVRLTAADDPGGRLRPGMFVEVELLQEPIQDSLLLASDAILANERGSYVVRARRAASPSAADHEPSAASSGPPMPPGWVADFVPVRVLGEVDALSAIVSLGPPLEVGDRIVLVGADNAFPGAPLLVRDPVPVDRSGEHE